MEPRLELGPPLHFNASRLFPNECSGYYCEMRAGLSNFWRFTPMLALLTTPRFAAAGDAMIYLFFGGGEGGGRIIFIEAKLFGK